MNMIQLSSRIYRLLLRAYPAHFAAEFGEDMLWCFEAACTDRFRKSGVWGIAAYWFHILPDWALTVTKERLKQSGYEGADTMDTMQFNHQYRSMLAVFSRALRAGYNIKQAFEIIAEHAPEPTRSFAAQVLLEVDQGSNLLDAIRKASTQSGSEYPAHLVEMLEEQRANGGNFADKLDAYQNDLLPVLEDQGWAQTVDLQDGYPQS
jgi:hypothetical protein